MCLKHFSQESQLTVHYGDEVRNSEKENKVECVSPTGEGQSSRFKRIKIAQKVTRGRWTCTDSILAVPAEKDRLPLGEIKRVNKVMNLKSVKN